MKISGKAERWCRRWCGRWCSCQPRALCFRRASLEWVQHAADLQRCRPLLLAQSSSLSLGLSRAVTVELAPSGGGSLTLALRRQPHFLVAQGPAGARGGLRVRRAAGAPGCGRPCFRSRITLRRFTQPTARSSVLGSQHRCGKRLHDEDSLQEDDAETSKEVRLRTGMLLAAGVAETLRRALA